MLHDIIEEYKIELEFDDGKRGVVNFSINEDLGTLTWHDKIDIAPETLYAEATGSALPDWVEQSDDSSMDKPFHFFEFS